MVDEPTLGEVMRQVQGLVRQVESLIKEVRLDYVRKDLYEARHTHITRRMDELEREADDRERSRQAFQRQVWAGIIIGVVVLLAQLLVTLTVLRPS